jgi:Protein of unknown function (DUF5672)
MRLQLPEVTLVAVDRVVHDLTRLAVAECLKHAEFAEVLLFSDREIMPAAAGVRHVHSAPGTLPERVYWYEVPPRVKTAHMLIVQWDSWIVNPAAWTAEFLEYDWIGAPWWHRDGRNVGNGGFSLRSTRLMQALRQGPQMLPLGTPEDEMICRTHRPALESAGFRFAPEELAIRFSFERTVPAGGTPFGFHGLFNWPRVLSVPQIGERLRHFNDYALGRPECRELFLALAGTEPWGSATTDRAPDGPADSRAERRAGRRPGAGGMIVDPADLRCPEAFADAGESPRRRDGALAYEPGQLARIAEPVLFYGPYIALDAGVYLIKLEGCLAGAVRLRFTHSSGAPISETVLSSFAEPVLLILPHPVAAFEVSALRTPTLEALRLEAIAIERIDAASPA